jgi:hypothetical protein
LEDMDSLPAGAESVYAALLAALASGQPAALNPEIAETGAEQTASSGQAGGMAAVANGIGAAPEVEGHGAEVVSRAVEQLARVKNDPANAAAAQKLAENPNVAGTVDNGRGTGKVAEGVLTTGAALMIEGSGLDEAEQARTDAGKELFKILEGKLAAKSSGSAAEAASSHTGKENGSLASGISSGEEAPVNLSGEIQSGPLVDSSETRLAEAVKSGAGRSDTQMGDFDPAHISSGQEAAGKTDSAAKEFVNIREGVEFVRLPSGQMVDKYAVLDQVINQVSLRNAEEGKTLTLRMHPQELGDLKLDLILEQDKIRVNIQSQTQVVQDVLETHLPRLREALEAQGLKVGDMQLSLDFQQQEGSESFRQFNTGQDSRQRHFQFSGQGENSHLPDQTGSLAREHSGAGRQNAIKTGLSLRI